MLEKPDRLLLHQLRHHVTEDRTHGVESLVCGADVCQTDIVEEYLLNDENCDGLAQFRAGLHNAKAKRDNFGSQEEVDHI